MKSKLLIGVVFTLCCAVNTYGQDGFLDPTFGIGGIVTTDIDDSNDVANDLIIQADGKIIASGYTSNGIIDFFCLIRYNINGTLDTFFGEAGKVVTTFPSTSVGTTMALQQDGKIVVAGQTWTGTVNTFALARYLEDGTLDASFGNAGIVTTTFSNKNSVGHAISIQNDGKIVVGGHIFVLENDNDDFALARYHTNGDLDDSFGNSGLVITDFGIPAMDWLNDLQIQGDGKIIAAGFSGTSFTLVRYLINGDLDPGFGNEGVVQTAFAEGTFANIKSINIQADNKIVAAGFVLDSFSNFALTRYLSSGELDLSFGDQGKVITHLSPESDGINSIQIQADGKIIAGGTVNENLIRKFALVRYENNGQLDFSFGDNGIQTTLIHPTTNILNAIALQDGNIVAAGLSGDFPYDFTLARYTTESVGTDNIALFPGQLSLYPNPAQDFVTVKFNLDASYIISMQLLNAQGQLLQNIVKNRPSNQSLNKVEINISTYPSGVYYVVFEVAGEEYLLEVVK